MLYLKVAPALGDASAQALLGSAGLHLADVALPPLPPQEAERLRGAAQLLLDCAADVLASEGARRGLPACLPLCAPAPAFASGC